MKVLVTLCAVVACVVAKPYLGVAYSEPTSYSYSTSVVSVSKPGVTYVSPAHFPYAPAPAHVAYAAVPAPAPVAPAAVAVPAPAHVAYAAVPAPAPVAPAAVAIPAPAPVAYAAVPAPAPVAPAAVAYPAPEHVAYAAVPAPAPVAPAVVPVHAPAVKSQYHAQNEIGEASYGHAEPGQTHNAVQDAHGNKIGSFSYVNPEGEVLRTDYVADGAGYRVASNALPAAPIVTPIDTPEVAAAKASFFHDYAAKATHARRRRSAVLVQTPASTAPLAPAYVAAPHSAVTYAVPAPAPITYAVAAPVPEVTYTSLIAPYAPAHATYAAIPAPAPYAAIPAPAPYPAAPAPAPYAAVHAPAVRPATLTTIVNNPGHAVSYRVD